jgi:hypothetical protein
MVGYGTNTVPFGMKDVVYHDGGEQGDGEEPGDQRGEIQAGADAGVAGGRVEVDEVSPDREEVADLGQLPHDVRPDPRPRQDRERHQPDHVLR